MTPPAKDTFRKTVHQFAQNLNWQDVIAGLSIAGLLLPQALAYSGIGNLPAQAGIIGLFAGLLCYGLLGSSRFALVSPTSSSAVVLAAATMTSSENTSLRFMLASGLVIVTGVIFILAAITRMGNVTDFIAKPVLRGFTFGLAIIIMIKQATAVLNIDIQEENLFIFILDVFRQFNAWNYACLLTTLVALFFLALMEWLRKIRQGLFKNIPSGTFVIILGILASKLGNLPAYGIPNVGTIDINLNNLMIPTLTYSEWIQLLEIGVALVFILYAESYGSIRSFAMKHHDTISPNRDLLALGISNLVSGIFQGMPVGAGYSATAANEAYGAKTRLAGLFSMIITLIIILTVLPYIEWIPIPVLAAIVIFTMATTLSLSSFRLYFSWKIDRILIVTSVLAVLLLGVLQGLIIAIAISLLMMLRQNSKSTVSILGRLGQSHDFVNLSLFPEAHPVSGILILRPDQGLFFANADRILLQVRELIASASRPIHTVILSLEQTTDLDASCVEALRDFFIDIKKEEKKLILSRLKNPVHEILQFTLKTPFPDVSLSHLSVAHAVRLAQTRKPQNNMNTTDIHTPSAS